MPNLVKRINLPIEIIFFAIHIYIYFYRLSNPRSLSSYLWLSTFEELINPKARYTFSQENVFLLHKRILDCISSNTFLKRVNKILISFIFSSCFESDRRLRCSNFHNSSESVLFEAKVKNIVYIWKLAVDLCFTGINCQVFDGRAHFVCQILHFNTVWSGFSILKILHRKRCFIISVLCV